MANYKWPNVYPSIKDLSGVVATNSVTSCAYVGEAEFGPINKPTLLSTLKDYTSKFGALNSAKYGYAGYSLAVASESIDTHYFVRVVKAGPNADTGEHDADDAKFGSLKVPVSGSESSAQGGGYYVETIENVIKEENGSGLFTDDNYRISRVTLDTVGSGYKLNDELTVPLTPTAGKVRVTRLEQEYTTVDAVVSAAGENYQNGDTLTVELPSGQNATFTASTLEGGMVNTVILVNGGKSNAVFDGEYEVTGGAGTGCKLQLTTANTGKIAAVSITDSGASETEEITNPVSLVGGNGTGAKVNVNLTNTDMANALVFVASNPNNLKVSVKLTDSTINENRAYAFSSVTYEGSNYSYVATISDVNDAVLDDLKVGSLIELTRTSNTQQEGVFEVTEIDTEAKTVKFNYTSSNDKNGNELVPVELVYGKVSKYPDPNERTFQVDVYLTQGKLVQNVETYQYCTLYQAKNSRGESMYIEDVINGSSDYVMVYVNPNLLAALSEDEVLEPMLNYIDDSPMALIGGQSGGRPGSKDLNAGWDQFKDRSQVTVSLLMNSGYSNSGETSYQNKMLEIAEYRRDCFCLFDVPMSEVEADDAIDWRKNIFGSNSYRGALSSPWVRTYDAVQGRANFVMCPSAFVAKLIGAAGDPWNAPAGPNRGIISSSTVSPTGLTQAYDSVIGGTLYADNQINCIVRDTSAGYVNWGQRTLQQKPSALDRINVARTVIYIETILRDAARWHLFQNNTPYERMQITLQFSSFLDTVLSAEGIASYKVICDDTNNTPIVIQNNQLVIDVIITPVYAAESIILNTTITGADASVSITSSAN